MARRSVARREGEVIDPREESRANREDVAFFCMASRVSLWRGKKRRPRRESVASKFRPQIARKMKTRVFSIPLF